MTLLQDFHKICDFGGRLSGTTSEARSREWLRSAGSDALKTKCIETPVHYQGWRSTRSELTTSEGVSLACHPLVRSRPTPENGLTAEVVDLGRGLAEDFKQHADLLKGRIALFRHEVMFSPSTFHRRQKLRLALEAGAVGALVAAIVPDELVTGSSRGEGESGIPAMGITAKGAAALAPKDGQLVNVKMFIDADEAFAQSTTLTFDLPGETDKWFVLSAHIDGHDLAESAMDNATGVAAALEVARRVREHMPHRHGLRLAFFSVEEWGLTGSDQYLESLPVNDLENILLNVNLDSVAGGTDLTALTSGFSGLSEYLSTRTLPANLRIHEPLQKNSDHANFAARGIPAFRLLSGFDEPESNVRYVLTGKDTRDKVNAEDLEKAVELTTTLLLEFLQVDELIAAKWRHP